MKILVIGGTGFVGLPLVKNLLCQNHDLVVVSRGRKACKLPSEVSHIQIYRKDSIKFKKCFYGKVFDAIYDLAAFTPRNIIQIGETFPRPVRYIMVSSASVYGEGRNEAIEENAPISPTPWHDYGYNKWIAEQELSNYPHLSWITVRPCVVYGPRDPHEPRASYFMRRIWHQTPVIIPGSRVVRNNYLYVDDLAELLVLCMDAPEKTVVNAAGAQAFTWTEYLETLAKVMGKPTPLCKFLGMSLEDFRHWEHCKSLQFHHNAFYNFVLDIERARGLGWEPAHSLQQGLKATWKWIEGENREWALTDDRLRKERKWAAAYFE